MCGIFCLVENTVNVPNENNQNIITENYKNIITTSTTLLNHRGPDSNGNRLIIDPNFNKTILMLHTRLQINGDSTKQPLVSKDNKLFLIINGEIFNWKQLEKDLDYTCTMSDCEIIFPLYEKYKNNIPKMLNLLRGQFSFILYDLENKHILIARDPIGITPLYIGYKKSYQTKSGDDIIVNRVVISSELKCLTRIDKSNYNNQESNGKESLVDNIKIFYPRSYIYTFVKEIYDFMGNAKTYINFYDNYSDIESTSRYRKEYNMILENIREKGKKDIENELKNQKV